MWCASLAYGRSGEEPYTNWPICTVYSIFSAFYKGKLVEILPLISMI